MLSELARCDVPDFGSLMTIRLSDLSAVERVMVGLESPSSPDETVGGYCFTSAIPHQLVAARMACHIIE
jgi:hypothetical protein